MPPADEITEDDLDILDAFLISDNVAEDSMTLPILDGFLTAVAIGPELIMPSEWLPLIWGSHSPAWESEVHAEIIIGIIMARYNEILRTVRQGEEYFEPVFAPDYRDEHISCEEWAHGFMTGFALRAKTWTPMEESDTHRGYIGCIAVQRMSESEVRGADGGKEGNLFYMWKNGADLIPEAVVEIDRFWKKVRGQDDGKDKTGRNDQCPCGSGKKYKKCCGSN